MRTCNENISRLREVRAQPGNPTNTHQTRPRVEGGLAAPNTQRPDLEWKAAGDFQHASERRTPADMCWGVQGVNIYFGRDEPLPGGYIIHIPKPPLTTSIAPSGAALE